MPYFPPKRVTITPWTENGGGGVRAGTVTHSKNEEHWPVRVRILATKMGLGWRFPSYERHSEPGTTAKSHSSAGKTHRPPSVGSWDCRAHCRLDWCNLRLFQLVPLRFSLFSEPVACTVESSSFALCTSCIFRQQFLRTDALFPPSRWPFCTNSRLPASVILIEESRETC